MKIVKYLYLFLSLIFFSCSGKSDPVSSNINFSYFCNSWQHSYEEEDTNSSIKIFRPGNYKTFPTSRFRESITFYQNNTCVYSVPGADDLPLYLDGSWKISDNDKTIIIILDSKKTEYKKFRIIELTQDILKYSIVIDYFYI